MKLSPKKKNELYNIIYNDITSTRISLQNDLCIWQNSFLTKEQIRSKVDYAVAQIIMPLFEKLVEKIEETKKK